MGTNKEDQWAVPVDDTVDPHGPRTSQRAELLAAIAGVKVWTEFHRAGHFNTDHVPIAGDDPLHMILATDSQYVVKASGYLSHLIVRLNRFYRELLNGIQAGG